MTKPSAELVDGEAANAPDGGVLAIVIANRSWPVPRLSPKQNRIVVPALLAVVPRIVDAHRRSETGTQDRLFLMARYLDTPTYDRIADAVFHALTRAHPQLSRTEFDELPIDTLDLLGAITVIARQAGLLGPQPAENPAAQPAADAS